MPAEPKLPDTWRATAGQDVDLSQATVTRGLAAAPAAGGSSAFPVTVSKPGTAVAAKSLAAGAGKTSASSTPAATTVHLTVADHTGRPPRPGCPGWS